MTAQQSTAGRCWVFGDDINTDFLAPGKYMKFGIETIAQHCMEDVDPDFAGKVRPGDVIIGGSNFGAGSSREQAAEVLRFLGVRCVVARSFAGLFYRNGFNLGLPLLVGPAEGGASWGLANGQAVEADLARARLWIPAEARAVQCAPIPGHLLALVEDGGLVPHLHKRLQRERQDIRNSAS